MESRHGQCELIRKRYQVLEPSVPGTVTHQVTFPGTEFGGTHWEQQNHGFLISSILVSNFSVKFQCLNLVLKIRGLSVPTGQSKITDFQFPLILVYNFSVKFQCLNLVLKISRFICTHWVQQNHGFSISSNFRLHSTHCFSQIQNASRTPKRKPQRSQRYF